MASKIIFDESEAERAKDHYAETLVRMSLSELLYHVLTRDESSFQRVGREPHRLTDAAARQRSKAGNCSYGRQSAR
jgi:hypothetical protein